MSWLLRELPRFPIGRPILKADRLLQSQLLEEHAVSAVGVVHKFVERDDLHVDTEGFVEAEEALAVPSRSQLGKCRHLLQLRRDVADDIGKKWNLRADLNWPAFGILRLARTNIPHVPVD